MTAPADNLPNRIREHRLRVGLTLEKLGAQIGVSKGAVGMLERGDRPLTIERQRSIARVLGVDMAELLSPTDHPAALTEEEKRHLANYRQLDMRGKRAVSNVAENLLEWRAAPADPDIGNS